MDIQKIVKQRLIPSQRSTAQSFKKGIILGGEILELLPKSRAQIQLGSRMLIAQLEALLQLGASYHFQV